MKLEEVKKLKKEIFNIEDIKRLREISHAGYADCKKVLAESGGDFDEAIRRLRDVGHKIQEKHSDRETPCGVIKAYIHPGGRIASMVEIRCETDFVAKTDDLHRFAREIAMQVVAMKPEYISRKDVPQVVVAEERSRKEQAASETPFDTEAARKEYVDVQMERWFGEGCLLEQPYVRDGSLRVKDLLASLVASLGESCKISRIQRWEID